MERPSDLYEKQTKRVAEQQHLYDDENDIHHATLSLPPKESRHGALLFSDDNEKIRKDDTDWSRECITTATLDLPLEFKNGKLVAEKRIRTQVHCEIPRRADNGEWSASVGGSSYVLGPLGYVTGQMALAYHLSNRAKIVGGMQVGDLPKLYTGFESRSSASSHWSVLLYSLPNEPCVGTTITTTQRWGSLLETRVTLDSTSSNFQPKGRVSISTRAIHKVQLLLGWNRHHPQVQLSVRPKVSTRLYSDVSFGMDGAGRWHVGAALKQTLTAKVAPSSSPIKWTFKNRNKEFGTLGLGFRLNAKKGVAWILSWSHRGVHIHVPVTISTRPDTMLYSVQALSISLASTLIQKVIEKMWNSTVSDALEKQNLEKQRKLLQQQKARRDAEQQRDLMVRQATIRKKAEEQGSGLVIIEATYRGAEEEWDVTTQLQFWTTDATLELPASSKQHLLGFYNVSTVQKNQENESASVEPSWLSKFWTPCDTHAVATEGPMPTLTVKYKFSGDVYTLSVQDSEALSLPNAKAVPVKS